MKKVNGPSLVRTAIRIAQGEIDKKDVHIVKSDIRFELQLAIGKEIRVVLAWATTAEEIDDVHCALVGYRKFPCGYCKAKQLSLWG